MDRLVCRFIKTGVSQKSLEMRLGLTDCGGAVSANRHFRFLVSTSLRNDGTVWVIPVSRATPREREIGRKHKPGVCSISKLEETGTSTIKIDELFTRLLQKADTHSRKLRPNIEEKSSRYQETITAH